MSSSILDIPDSAITQFGDAPDAPTVAGFPEVTGYSSGFLLDKKNSILPALLGSFELPQINVDLSGLGQTEDVKTPDIDVINEKAEEEGMDPIEWVDENIIKPVDQGIIRPVDQFLEDYIVDPTSNVIKSVDEFVGDYLVDPTSDAVKAVFKPATDLFGNIDNYLDEKFAGFTTPEIIDELKEQGGEYLSGATSINDFIENPNSATALEFVKGVDKIYATATGSSIPQTITMPEIDIEGTGVTGGEEIQVSNIFSPEAVSNFQDVAAVVNISSFVDDPTVEKLAAVYGDALHLTQKHAPEIYEILGAEKAEAVVGNAGAILNVVNAIDVVTDGVDSVSDGLQVVSGIASGTKLATKAGLISKQGTFAVNMGAMATPLTVVALGAMAYELTKNQDFPRAFTSIEYDKDYSYQSGYYGYKDETNPEGDYIYALDELTGRNAGGYGPFKFGEGRTIDGSSYFNTDNNLKASQEFANWMVTGLGYEVDEEAFKRFSEDGGNFIGGGDVGYLKARHGYKNIKTDATQIIDAMIKEGVFVSNDNTIKLDPEDWQKSIQHLTEASEDRDSFLYNKLNDISPVLTGDLRQNIDTQKNKIMASAEGLFERQEELKQNPDLAAEEIKNTLIQGVIDAEGSIESKTDVIETILAMDNKTTIDSVFDASKAMTDAYQFKNLGIPDDPYTRAQESMQFQSGPNPFGFYGALPYIG